MTKQIAKIGNSNGIIFDATIMDMAHLQRGDEVNVEIHDGGVITLTPIRSHIEAKRAASTAARLIRKNTELFRRLA
jgi:antitoxin component of MazEF toxin-antitoxin module